MSTLHSDDPGRFEKPLADMKKCGWSWVHKGRWRHCNRPAGHEGGHAEYRRDASAVRPEKGS